MTVTSRGLARCLAFILILTIATLLAACGAPAQPAAQPNSAESPPTGEAEEPTEEAEEAEEQESSSPSGELVIADAEAPEFLDPTMSLQILNWTISFTMYDTLVKMDGDGNIVPSLATEWEAISPTSWQFTLRDDVKFHDGTPFTSAAVKATLDHITDEATGSRQSAIWGLYDRAETPDDHTVIIHTKEPMGTMLTSLALTTIIDPNNDKLNEQPNGTGPFKFVEWKKDDRLVVEANPDYWGGAPKLERIVFRTIPELSTRISALEAGEVDVVNIVPAEEFERLEAAGITLIEQPTTYLRFIWLGNEGPLADVRVRQAINLAIDREAIIQDLFLGEGYPVTGCVAPGVVGYAEMPPLEYNPERAAELMAEAGYADGFTLEMKTTDHLSKGKELGEVLAAYLGELGIEVEMVFQDQALWVEDLLALNWQSNLLGTGTLTGDADYTLRRLYHSSAKRVPYSDPKLDELLIAQLAATDEVERQELFRQACEILWEDVPVLFLFGTIQTYGVNPRVSGLEPRPSQFLFFENVSVTE